MLPVQTGDAVITLRASRRIGKSVHDTTDQMSQRMTAQRVTAEQDHVHAKHDRSNTDTKVPVFALNIVIKPKSTPGVVGQKAKEDQGKVKKVTVNVLNDQGKRVFAEITLARFAYGTGGRVSPKSLVVGTAIVVTGHSKAGRKGQNQQGRRKG